MLVNNRRSISTGFLALLATSALLTNKVWANDAMAHSHHHSSSHSTYQTTPLTEAGQSIFATVSEVVAALEANPNTDWSKVNIPALYQHLVDMKHVAENVRILREGKTKHGISLVLEVTERRTREALDRVLPAHANQLKESLGWHMQVQRQGKKEVHIQVNAHNEADRVKIQALGYMGVMAYGNHHQPHHWLMATGQAPH